MLWQPLAPAWECSRNSTAHGGAGLKSVQLTIFSRENRGGAGIPDSKYAYCATQRLIV